MQDGHQVHHRVVPRHGTGQGGFVMHVEFQHGEPGQRDHVTGVVAAPGGHRDLPAFAHQFFTHMGTDKTCATQNQYFFHDFTLVE